MSRSERRTVPALALSSPERRLISVDLPAPFGPMTAWISPTWTSSDTPATARSPPKRFSRPRAASATSGMAGLADRECLGGPPSRHPGRGAERHLEQLADAVREGEHDDHDDDALDELPVLGRGAQ